MNKICRLCFQTINGNYETIGQSFNNTLKMNMDICKEAVKCIECTNNLEMFIKFKSACHYMSEWTLTTDLKDDINLDPDKMEITNSLMSLLEPNNEVKCCFCKKTRGRESLTSLNESKEHTFLVNVLKEHIPKLNLNITEELLTCAICFDGLQTVLSFLIKCLDVEQKISKYIEIKGTDDKGQIELEDAQQFIFDPTIKIEVDSKDVTELKEECTMQAEAEIKHEEETQDIQKLIMNPTIKFEIKSKDGNELRERHDRFQEGHAIQTEANIKYEKEIENIELSIKAEEIDIKSDQSDCDSFQEPSFIIKTDNGALDISLLKLQRRHKKFINQREMTHKISEGKKVCSYEANHLKQHSDVHKARGQDHIKQHKFIHKSNSEITTFKCELCSYETKHRSYLKRHKLIHKSTSELTMFKCALCPYEAKRKQYLRRHTLTHKSISELKMFKCELCSYQTKQKHHLIRHKLTNKHTLHKCELCSFETKLKHHLIRHKLTHESTLELRPFKCEESSHELIHESTSELTMFKCELCSYETKRRPHLKSHNLMHQSSSELTIFKCELCSYKAKYKNHLQRHQLCHKSTSELKMFKCEHCSYEAKRMDFLKRHKLKH